VSLATRIDISESEKKIVQKCFKELGGETIRINEIDFPISSIDKERVIKLNRSLYSIPNSVFKDYQTFKDLDLSEVTVPLQIKIKRVVKNIEDDSRLISKLLQIHLYSKMGLKGKVSSLLSSIVNNDYLTQFYMEEYSHKNKSKINELVLHVLENLYEKTGSKARFETLVAYLLINADEELRKSLSSKFDVPDRLSYVREKTLSFNNAARFPYAWAHWIEKYSSEKELLLYMDKALIYDRIKINPLLLINFYSTFPLETRKRNEILKAFRVIFNSTKEVEKEVSIRLLSENKMASVLKRKINGKLKPLFQIEKKFYTENLHNNKATLYSIYRLLKLGLFESEFLLHIYASRL
jgi:hypothetical protein